MILRILSRHVPRGTSMLAMLCMLCILSAGIAKAATAQWQDALKSMPLPPGTPRINRDNAVALLLPAFRSNVTVKGLLVLPDVADDFYLIHRDSPKLELQASNLYQALILLTNATEVRLTFRDPFLLVHMPSDRLEPTVAARDPSSARALKSRVAFAEGWFADTHWDRVQPRLASALKRPVVPEPGSQEAWHFARHNFAACNLTGWELLEAVSLTGHTAVTVQKRDIVLREWTVP